MHPSAHTIQAYRWPALAWLVLFGFFSMTAFHVADWPVFSSPDETANYAFAAQFQHDNSVILPVDHNAGSPRSVVNRGFVLTPASFGFFPAFLGSVGKVAGSASMLFVGPALAATAALCFWALARRVLQSATAATWATAVFATAPTYWFYASRGFWQNGVFTSLLVIAAWLATHAAARRWWPVSALCGLVAGLAVATRPSELVWLVPAFLVALVLLWKRVRWVHLGIGVVAAILPVLALLSLQDVTYGDPLAVGYRQAGLFTASTSVNDVGTVQRVREALFPFGTSVRAAVDRFSTNGIPPLSYLVIVGVAGFAWLLLRSRTTHVTRSLLVSAFVGGAVLILLYGNYRFVEYPVSRIPTLGSSYLRYWLPLIPLFSIGVGALVQELRARGWLGRGLAWTFGVALLVLNLTHVATADIGVLRTFPRFSEWQAQSRWVVEQTPPQAVIVAGSNDKLVFPRRQAIGFDGGIPPASLDLAQLARTVPAYVLLGSTAHAEQLQQRYAGSVAFELAEGPGGLILLRCVAQPAA